MRSRRWPWLLAAALMVVAAAAVAGAVYLHWLPCRGTMLSGSLLRGYAYGPDFAEACLRRMDTGLPFPYPPEPAEVTPWATELGVGATGLLGLAWLALILSQRWSVRTRTVAALPGLACLVLAVVGAASRDLGRSLDDYAPGWLLNLELWAVIALVAVWLWEPQVRGRIFVRLVVVAYGTTAVGIGHGIGEYILMSSFSDANWDVPPGTGYTTAGAIAVSAVLTLIMTIRPPQTPAEGTEPRVSASSVHQATGVGTGLSD